MARLPWSALPLVEVAELGMGRLDASIGIVVHVDVAGMNLKGLSKRVLER